MAKWRGGVLFSSMIDAELAETELARTELAEEAKPSKTWNPVQALKAFKAKKANNTSTEHPEEFRRSWLTGSFVRPATEIAYRDWHALHHRWTLCYMCFTLGIFFIGGAVVVARDSGPNMGLRHVMHDFPEVRTMTIATTCIARTMIVCIGFLLLAPTTRIMWTGSSYNWITFVCLLTPVVVETVPIILIASARIAEGTTAIIAQRALLPQVHADSSNNSVASACSGTTQDPALMSRGAYWSCTSMDFMLYICSGLSGLSPGYATILGLCTIALTRTQNELVWHLVKTVHGPFQWVGGEEGSCQLQYPVQTLVPPLLLGVPVVGVLLISLLTDVGRRDEFRIRQLLRMAKNDRIEQLQVEKERLAWEKRLFEKSTSMPTTAVPPEQAAAPTADPKTAPSGTHSDSEAAHPPPGPFLQTVEPKADLFNASAFMGAGEPPSVSGGSCSELDGIMMAEIMMWDGQQPQPSAVPGDTNRQRENTSPDLSQYLRGAFSSGAPSSVKSEDEGSVVSSHVSSRSNTYAGTNGTTQARLREAVLWQTLRDAGLLTRRREPHDGAGGVARP